MLREGIGKAIEANVGTVVRATVKSSEKHEDEDDKNFDTKTWARLNSAILMAMAMLETTTLDAKDRDATKDGTPVRTSCCVSRFYCGATRSPVRDGANIAESILLTEVPDLWLQVSVSLFNYLYRCFGRSIWTEAWHKMFSFLQHPATE